MSEREYLVKEIEVKVSDLAKKYEALKNKTIKLGETLDLLTEENELLKSNIQSMKMAKVLSINNTNIQDTHRTLTQLIHEIDKCIAQLSV